MSHTSILNKTTFNFNSDMSGDITIKNDKGELEVDGKDLIQFIVNYLKKEKIRYLENMDFKTFIEKFI
jgi:hypothetical protein